MSITLVDKKSIHSVLQKIQSGLSKYFVTAGDDTFEETSEYLGMTNIANGKSNISYVLYAQYSKHSIDDNPIIEIGMHYQENTISKLVYIKKVNPKHATMLEMFALCSFADDKNLYEGEAVNSFQQLKGYAHNAAVHGIFQKITQYKDFCNKKIDWDYVINAVKDVYLEKESFDQYQECLKLMELFDYFYEKCIV